jgi:hypothetical protein
MPQPSPSDVHVNVPLTNISVAYAQSQTMFVADQVFPVVPVGNQSNRYFVYQRDDWYRIEAQLRAPSTESAGGGWRIDNTPNYFANVYAVHKDIDDQTMANADGPIQMDRDATLWATQQLLIKRDDVFMTNYFATSKWTGGTAGGDQTGVAGAPTGAQFKQWDQAGSTPIEDIRKQIYGTLERTGVQPNKLLLGPYTWRVLQDHPEFLDRIKYTQRGMVSPDLLAAVLELDSVLIAKGVKVTGNETTSTTNTAAAFLAAKAALLVYAAPSPSLMTPSGGYIFAWTGYVGAGPAGQRITTMRLDQIRSNRVEAEMAFDAKLVAADLGVFFTSAVA